MKTKKWYFAWARKAGSESTEMVITRIKATSLRTAKKWFKDNGYIFEELSLSKIQNTIF